MPLTDTQLILLSAASQRDDRLLVRPERLKGGAAAKVVAGLLRHALVAEVPVRRDAPAWRISEAERPLGLRITAAGLAAIGLDDDETPAEQHAGAASHATTAPRAGSKAAHVLALLARPEGATLDDLVAATGWLPHTTRATLTGLRRKGYGLARSRDDGGASRYRLVATRGGR